MTKRGTGWPKRVEVIRKEFPAVVQLDWARLIVDEPEVIGAVLKDVLRSMQAVPSKPGPRPQLDLDEAQPVVDRWLERDPLDRPYATVAFPQAFRALVRGGSMRQVARKLNWSKNQVWRLMGGLDEPSIDQMVQVAEAYGKRPSYFVEYRVGWAVTVFAGAMESAPEHTVRVYESLQRAVS